MRNAYRTTLLAFVALILVGIAFVSPTSAAPQPTEVSDRCRSFKRIENWRSTDQLARMGFHTELFGEQGSLDFVRERRDSYAAFNLAANPNSAEYTASRISESDGTLPIAERIKCWQATERRNIAAEFTIRFDQGPTPAGMTETAFLWNSPLPAKGSNEPTQLLTSFGVSRSQGAYQAVALQDLNFATFEGLYNVQPMPTWLDAAEWHTVRLTISQTNVQIQVSQGDQPFTTVLEAELLHPAELLSFEFSIDNEAFPGYTVPVVTADGLDVDLLEIRLANARGPHASEEDASDSSE